MKSLLLLLLLFCSIPAFSQVTNGLTDTARAKMDSVVNSLMMANKIVGASVAIVEQGRILYARGFGYADRRKKINASAETIYGIGSTTKTFTALAIMKLRDEGKIDIDKPASFYIPELKIKSMAETGDVLKIKNLLSHTSGLTDGTMNRDMCTKEDFPFTTVINDLNEEVLVHKANWKFSYSNIAFDLLGCIIERVSGMKYEDYITKNFLEKMDMKHSGFYNNQGDTLFSKGYLKDTVETPEPVLRDMPAGRLLCSVDDMAHFMIMVMNEGKYGDKQIISKQALLDMETVHTRDVGLYDGTDYGYGMFMQKMYCKEDSVYGNAVGHPGDTHVFHSSCFMFPKTGVGLVVLTNSENGSSFCNTAYVKLFGRYERSVKGLHLHTADPVIPDSARAVAIDLPTEELAGDYATGEEIPLKVKRINSRKVSLEQNRQILILKREKDGLFSVKAMLLNIIPLKVKGVFLGFEKKNVSIYITEVNKKKGRTRYDCIKDSAALPASDAWKKAAGKYKIINACQGNLQGAPEQIKIEGNKIYLKVRWDKKNTSYFSFNPISDTMAAIDGIDRRSGMIMKILPNGHVYFSGYELEKL